MTPKTKAKKQEEQEAPPPPPPKDELIFPEFAYKIVNSRTWRQHESNEQFAVNYWSEDEMPPGDQLYHMLEAFIVEDNKFRKALYEAAGMGDQFKPLSVALPIGKMRDENEAFSEALYKLGDKAWGDITGYNDKINAALRHDLSEANRMMQEKDEIIKELRGITNQASDLMDGHAETIEELNKRLSFVTNQYAKTEIALQAVVEHQKEQNLGVYAAVNGQATKLDNVGDRLAEVERVLKIKGKPPILDAKKVRPPKKTKKTKAEKKQEKDDNKKKDE